MIQTKTPTQTTTLADRFTHRALFRLSPSPALSSLQPPNRVSRFLFPSPFTCYFRPRRKDIVFPEHRRTSSNFYYFFFLFIFSLILSIRYIITICLSLSKLKRETIAANSNTFNINRGWYCSRNYIRRLRNRYLERDVKTLDVFRDQNNTLDVFIILPHIQL